MSPHVLSAAVMSAGSARHSGQALWKAYGERALDVRAHMTRRDLRLLLQGFAEGALRDAALLRSLLSGVSWDQGGSASKDLCSIAASLARLKVSDAGIFGAIGARIAEDAAELPFADLGTLVGAFSQVLCRHPALLGTVAAQLELRTRAQPRELSPAVAASTLNALAICSYCDAALIDAMVNKVVLPRVSEFGTSHIALISNSLMRCAQTPSATATGLSLIAQCWMPHGQIDRASADELTYLAQAYARLRVAGCVDFNLALASGALGRLSSFGARRLVRFCSALRWLPSTGRAAFLAMAARHALVGVLPECSLGELGELLDALVATQTPVPEAVLRSVVFEVVAKAQAAAADLPGITCSEDLTDGHYVSSYTLATLAAAGSSLLNAEQGQHLLTALRPHVTALSRQKRLKVHALCAVLAAHAHFRIRDVELLEQMGRGAMLPETALPNHIEQMLVSLGGLDTRIEPLLSYIDAQAQAGAARALSLDGASQCLLAVAVLGPERLGRTVEALVLRAGELCAGGPGVGVEAARLAAAAGELGGAAAAALRPWLEATEVSGASRASRPGPPPRLEPPPPPGLLRAVLRTLRRAGGEVKVSASAGEACEAPGPLLPGGFRADLVLHRGGSAVALELDGPQRCYRSGRDALGLCRLKRRALGRCFSRVVRVGFWEWPAQEEAQLEFLRDHGLA